MRYDSDLKGRIAYFDRRMSIFTLRLLHEKWFEIHGSTTLHILSWESRVQDLRILIPVVFEDWIPAIESMILVLTVFVSNTKW